MGHSHRNLTHHTLHTTKITKADHPHWGWSAFNGIYPYMGYTGAQKRLGENV